jgi:hypothetical protein
MCMTLLQWFDLEAFLAMRSSSELLGWWRCSLALFLLRCAVMQGRGVDWTFQFRRIHAMNGFLVKN